MGSGRDNEDDDGGQDKDSTIDLMGLKGRSSQRQQGTWVSVEDGEEWKQSRIRHIRVRH